MKIPSPLLSLVRHDEHGSGTKIFHVIFVTHKFPITKNFNNRDLQLPMPNASPDGLNMFAEAVVLPYILILLEEYCEGSKSLNGFHYKKENQLHCCNLIGGRPKIQFVRSHSDVNCCLFTIPCMLYLRNNSSQESRFSCYLCAEKHIAPENYCDKQGMKKVLLRFSDECSSVFKLLRIGSYYMLKCSKDDPRCGSECCVDTSLRIKIFNSDLFFRRIYFSFAEHAHQDNFEDVHRNGSTLVDENDDKIDLEFQPNPNIMAEIPGAKLHFSEQLVGFMNDAAEAVAKEGFVKMIKILTDLIEVLSVSSCVQLLISQLEHHSEASGQLCSTLPVGGLISLRGTIENIHIVPSKSLPCPISESTSSFHNTGDTAVCIHVCDDHHMVLVRGALTKFAHPVGLWPGANATFYRILLPRASENSHALMLIPVSFIVINSVKEVYGHYMERTVPQLQDNKLGETLYETIPPCLLSQLEQCQKKKQIQFHCRVNSVHILVLENGIQRSVLSESDFHFNLPSFNVLLASFVLDDGSSLCYGWAKDDNAEKLFRLHDPALRYCFSFNSNPMGNIYSSYQIEELLKNDHIVMIENTRAMECSPGVELTFFSDSKASSFSEEHLIGAFMLNACCHSNLIVIGEVMDSSCLEPSLAEVLELHPRVGSMENLWITKVGFVDPVHESWTLLNELIASD